MQKMKLIMVLMTVAIATACTRQVYVPVESNHIAIRTDTVISAVNTRDSVYHRDSIYVDGITTYRDRYIYRYVTKHDTIVRQHTDTLTMTQTKTVTAKEHHKDLTPVLIIISAIALTLIMIYHNKMKQWI